MIPRDAQDVAAGVEMMSSLTKLESPNRLTRPVRERAGLSLAVADVGWFNTENLYREIDRESVSVLLLKCQDYLNGWRRSLYPWSRDCRLRQCGKRCGSSSLSCPADG